MPVHRAHQREDPEMKLQWSHIVFMSQVDTDHHQMAKALDDR